MPSKKRRARQIEASPSKSLAEELRRLRGVLRTTARAYVKRLDTEISEIAAWNSKIEKEREPNHGVIRDLGDMLALIRKLDAKPEKGRRKDLRKIDSIVGDLKFVREHIQTE